MTEGERLFHALSDVLPDVVRQRYPDQPTPCILSTRVAIEVAAYFGIEAQPMPCKVVAYNAAFKRHLDAGEEHDIEKWFREDGAHSVGIGFGPPRGQKPRYDGHLIATAGGIFGDFAIQQIERLSHGIITGKSLVGPYSKKAWSAENEHGTVIEYVPFEDVIFRQAPDWLDVVRRRPIVSQVIREVRPSFLSVV